MTSRTPGKPPARPDLDTLREELNQSLAQRRFDDAVAAARAMRELLKAKPRLDARELKSLAGAESVLRRFAEEGSTKVTSSKTRKIVMAVVTAVVILVPVVVLLIASTRGDRYATDASKALEALDRVDGVVSSGCNVHDYERYVQQARGICAPFFSKYADEKKTDISYQAMTAALAIYEKVLTDWPKSQASNKKLSTSELNTPVDYPHMWIAAHTLEVCALSVMRKDVPLAPKGATTNLARLAGHWSDGTVDLYYGPINASTGMGWFLSKTSRIEMGAYEARPVVMREEPRATSTATPSSGASGSPSPSPTSTTTAVATAPLKPDEVEIVRYTPKPTPIVVRVTGDRYAERYSNLQLLRMDDKTLP